MFCPGITLFVTLKSLYFIAQWGQPAPQAYVTVPDTDVLMKQAPQSVPQVVQTSEQVSNAV